MSCEFCDFTQEEKEWEVNLYESTSYEYEGKKYFLNVAYPADGEWRHRMKDVEAYFCPSFRCARGCGDRWKRQCRWLNSK